MGENILFSNVFCIDLESPNYHLPILTNLPTSRGIPHKSTSMRSFLKIAFLWWLISGNAFAEVFFYGTAPSRFHIILDYFTWHWIRSSWWLFISNFSHFRFSLKRSQILSGIQTLPAIRKAVFLIRNVDRNSFVRLVRDLPVSAGLVDAGDESEEDDDEGQNNPRIVANHFLSLNFLIKKDCGF